MTFCRAETVTAVLTVAVILYNPSFVTSHSLEVTKDTHDKQAKETCQRGYNVGYYVAEDGTICCNCKPGTFLVGDCKPYNFGEPWTTKCKECPFDPDDSDKQYYMPEETNDTQCLKADNEQHCEKMMNTHFEMGNNKTNSRCVCDKGYHMASTNITHGCHEDSPCKEGFEPSQRATNVSDTTCRPCPTGEFSDISSPSAMCKPFTLCRPGEFEAFAGNSTRDRHCVINTTIQNEPFSQPIIPTSSTEEAGAIEEITGCPLWITVWIYLEIVAFVMVLVFWVILLYRQSNKESLFLATFAVFVIWITIVIATIASAVCYNQNHQPLDAATILCIIGCVVLLVVVIYCFWKDVGGCRRWICQKCRSEGGSDGAELNQHMDSASEEEPLTKPERRSLQDSGLESVETLNAPTPNHDTNAGQSQEPCLVDVGATIATTEGQNSASDDANGAASTDHDVRIRRVATSSPANSPARRQDGVAEQTPTHAVNTIQANSGANPVRSAGVAEVPNISSSEVAATISSQPDAPNKAGPILTVPERGVQVEALHQRPIIQDNYGYVGFEEGLQQASERHILECCMKKSIKDVRIAGLMIRALEKWDNKDELHEFVRNCFPDVMERKLNNIERKHEDESRMCHEWMMLVIRTYGNRLTPEFIFKLPFQYQKMKDDMTKVFFEQLQPCQSHVGHC